MTPPRSRKGLAQRVRAARRQVLDVLPQLDTGRTPCACCGLVKQHNRTEAQAYTELLAVANKLDRWAHRLERGDQPDDTEPKDGSDD